MAVAPHVPRDVGGSLRLYLQPAALVIFAALSFAAEWIYRRWTGRKIKEKF